ncbi:hypothetical protein QR680_006222 [Steinernema hermaphroditum]|uniref:TIL domain-containing protein n=1 Tax=Steinernema hermaphroditum TaxID=289476 RepID=A0AA39HUQ5_9BILA|nr:hypothetical protein QR680_006222 [Steinernema hermaphroditum]
MLGWFVFLAFLSMKLRSNCATTRMPIEYGTVPPCGDGEVLTNCTYCDVDCPRSSWISTCMLNCGLKCSCKES